MFRDKKPIRYSWIQFLLKIDDLEILLLGRDTSITNTVKDMLRSVETWSVTKTSSIKNTTKKTSENSFYDLIVANLADFSPPPTKIIRKIKDHFPSSNLLVLYSYSQKLLIQPLLDAGANGYLQNGLSEDNLFEAVKTIAGGSRYISIESAYWTIRFLRDLKIRLFTCYASAEKWWLYWFMIINEQFHGSKIHV